MKLTKKVITVEVETTMTNAEVATWAGSALSIVGAEKYAAVTQKPRVQAVQPVVAALARLKQAATEAPRGKAKSRLTRTHRALSGILEEVEAKRATRRTR